MLDYEAFDCQRVIVEDLTKIKTNIQLHGDLNHYMEYLPHSTQNSIIDTKSTIDVE